MSFSFNRNNESRIIKKTLTNNIPASITNSSSLGSSNVTGLINLTSTNISTNNFTLNGIPITASATELNKLTGTTAVTSDFNKLASVTASADELNYNDITTVGTAEANKTLVVDSNKDITSIRNITSTGLTTTNLTLGATAVTASADELNKLTGTNAVTSDFNKIASVTASADELNKLTGTTAVTSDFNKLASVTASAAELNYNDITTVGTAEANKTLVVDSNKDITSIRNITSTCLTTTNLILGTTAVTASADELNKLTGATAVTSDFNKLASVTASAAELNKLTGTTAVTSDFNKLASVTASAAELNKLTGTTAVTSDFNKLASVTASATELNKLTGTTAVTSDFNKLATVTASADELNKLTGTTAVTSDFNKLASVTASADELNTLTGISIGTASANKALIVDTNKDLTGIRNLSITGDLNIAGTTTTINSTQVNIKDNILQLNSGPSGIYDSGLIIQRYQTNNDNNIGDIINDSVKENYTASSVTINTIVLPSNANSNNNYYNGWWIKINSASTGTNQTRQVLSYNGSSKTLTLTNNFTTLPTGTISVNLYNKTFSNFIWQENNKRFITSYTAQDISGTLTILDYADLSTNNLSILSTADSQSSSIGGSLTVSGGASIAKKLYIGTDLLIGGNITLNNTLITATAADINKLAGTTAVTSDFNKLATITATATEINKLAGTTAVTADFNKLASITATAADINKLATVTATAAELNYNDITTAGTAEANKALILNVNKDITSIRNITATGLTITNLTLGSTAITATGTELNKLAGTTAVTADFNKLATVTASAAELNYNDITTIGTAEASKALILDVNKDITSIRNITATGLTITNLTLGSTVITATGTELNKLAGTTAVTADFNKLASITATAADINKLATVTASAAELNYNDITSTGTAEANKALILNVNKDITSIRNITATGLTITNLTLGSTAITATGTELNYNDITTIGTAEASKALILDVNKDITGIGSLGLTNIFNLTNANASFRVLTFSDNVVYLQAGLNTNTDSAADIFIGNYNVATSASTRKIMIKSNGRVGIGLISPSYALDVSGDINLSGNYRSGGSIISVSSISGVTNGIAEASKALIVNSSRDISNINILGSTLGRFNTANSNAIISAIGSGSYLDGSYNRVLRCSGANASPVNIEIQCNSGSSTTTTNAGWIGTVSNNDLRLGANSTTNLIITNTGNVGINNNIPSYRLDVSGTINSNSNIRTTSAGTGFIHSEGSISLVSWINSSSLSTAFFGTSSNHSLNFQTNNADRMCISNTGFVGIGVFPNYPLHVSGSANYSGGFAFYAGSGSGTNTGTATNNTNTTIYASGRMVAVEFNAFSDNRIKKNISDINDISALNTLRLIQPKQYNYIDTLNKTSNPVLGFIAQQVSEVLDYSVNIITDYIPNIFQTSIKSLSENNDTILSFNNSINYDSNGTGKVKLINENDKIIYVTIKNKINNYSFSINETLDNIEYFIYGEEVNNYHSLNKDSIFTITTAAVQEIDRIVIEQKNKITTLENENQQLKDQIQNILIRLQNLENNN
jgi:hypothetical protein